MFNKHSCGRHDDVGGGLKRRKIFKNEIQY